MSGAALVPGLALLLAWAWDLRFGEPRNAWHPVAWLGSLLAPLGRRLAAWPPAAAFCGGALAWLVLAGGLAAAAWGWQQWATPWPLWLAVPALALVLKPMFAWRMLRDEVAAVDQALGVSLEAARAQLARLVSRDVSTASADEVREAAIATLAENLNDSLVAPLCWFVLAGLPGAVVYRLANTADAMWGYRGRYEWAGKWAARADDLLSWLPARLTALLLWRAGGWRLLRAEAGLTPSPNGGWPMGAMALRLGVRLRKTGVYALNGSAPSPGAADLPRALAAAGQAAGLALLLACAAVFGSAAWRA